MSTPAFVRVVEREARVYARLWRGLAFSTFVQPALYLGAMGVGLGGLVRAHTGSVSGLSYLDFVAPGLLVASSMQLAASESMWPVLDEPGFRPLVPDDHAPGRPAVVLVLGHVLPDQPAPERFAAARGVLAPVARRRARARRDDRALRPGRGGRARRSARRVHRPGR